MRQVKGKTKSGKTRYVISEYIVPGLMEGTPVYYYGEMGYNSMIDTIQDYLGDTEDVDMRKFRRLLSLSDLYEIENVMVVVDKNTDIEEVEKIDILGREVILISQVSSNYDMGNGNIEDEGVILGFDPVTFEVY